MSSNKPKRNSPYLLAAIGAVLGLGFIGACANSADDAAPPTSTTSKYTMPSPTAAAPVAPAVTTTGAPSPASAPAVIPAGCVTAPADLVDQVDGQLKPTGQTLADTFVVDSPQDYTYLGGNIMRGETKTSSADVWVAKDGFVLYALSGSAREETPQLADGRTLGLSAGDEYGQAVQDCSIASYRARQ